MEKAILKTLIYADIFDYPLKAYEIHRWLINQKSTLQQIEKALEKLMVKGRVKRVMDYYFLTGRDNLIRRRKITAKQSRKYLMKAKLAIWLLRIIPWIKLVGVSGGLAMENADKSDDIDLFVITAKNRLWFCRLLILGLFSIIGQRRKRQDKERKVAGKLCVNILLEEDNLEQKNKDVFIAHEVLQMKVLWQRDKIYSKYLADNEWALRFLPNWIAIFSPELGIMNNESRIRQKNHNSLFMLHNSLVNLLENLTKWLQLLIMKKPKGLERIADGAVYFHPQDCRQKILAEYKKRLTRL